MDYEGHPAPGGGGNQVGRTRMPEPRTIGAWLILAASLALALAIYYGFLGSSLVDHVAAWTATWTSHALNLLGTSTRVEGTILSSDSFAVNIVAECTAVGPLVLFIGAVAAFPSTARSKGLGVLLGVVVLTAVNGARIVSLFWIGSAYPEYLSVAHLLVWQSAIILMAIILWLFWVERLAVARQR
jgi:exosortase/archaeosortase family protein